MNIYKDGWHYLKQVFEDVWFYVEGGKLKKGIIGSNGDYITAYPFIYDYMTHTIIEI